MTSLSALHAELRQRELLDDARSRRVLTRPVRHRTGRIFGLTLPRRRPAAAR